MRGSELVAVCQGEEREITEEMKKGEKSAKGKGDGTVCQQLHVHHRTLVHLEAGIPVWHATGEVVQLSTGHPGPVQLRVDWLYCTRSVTADTQHPTHNTQLCTKQNIASNSASYALPTRAHLLRLGHCMV
jgi:hypothetical protein